MIKPHYSENRSILADVVPLKMPYSIQVEASQVCNIKCNYCMKSFIKQKNNRLMTLGIFDLLCRQIEDFNEPLKQLNFAGWGEPLMNKKLYNSMILIAAFREVAKNIAIITNGMLLDPDMSYYLIDHGLDHLRISLQGITSEKYQEICGKKIDFPAFVENIKWFYEHKGNCQVSIKIADIALADGDRERFFDTFEPITDRVYVESIRPMFAQNIQDGKMVSKYGIEHPPIKVCPQPFFMMSVTATGDILPCCNYYDPTGFGNIKDISLREVWEDEKMRKFRLMLLEGNRNEQVDYPACRGCLMPDATITPGDELDERADEIGRRL